MKTTHHFSIRTSLQSAWNTYKNNAWFLSCVFVGTLLISFITSLIADSSTLFGSIIGNLLSITISMLIAIGWTTVALKYASHQSVALKDFFGRYELFFKYTAATILYGLLVFAGFILFIIPGIFWAVKYKMYDYLIIEKNMGIIEAFRESGRITYGSKWKLFGFLCLTFAINLLGILALGIGFLVTAPIVILANAYVYKTLTKDTTAIQETPTPAEESIQEAIGVEAI